MQPGELVFRCHRCLPVSLVRTREALTGYGADALKFHGSMASYEIGPVLATVGTQRALDYPPDLWRIAPSQKMRGTLSGARPTFRLKRVTCGVDRDDSSVRFGAVLIPGTEP